MAFQHGCKALRKLSCTNCPTSETLTARQLGEFAFGGRALMAPLDRSGGNLHTDPTSTASVFPPYAKTTAALSRHHAGRQLLARLCYLLDTFSQIRFHWCSHEQ